jgi:hypothetical protein
MHQIAEWLEKLSLGQYAYRFAENDITVAILLDLTDQDLKELGVARAREPIVTEEDRLIVPIVR